MLSGYLPLDDYKSMVNDKVYGIINDNGNITHEEKINNNKKKIRTNRYGHFIDNRGHVFVERNAEEQEKIDLNRAKFNKWCRSLFVWSIVCLGLGNIVSFVFSAPVFIKNFYESYQAYINHFDAFCFAILFLFISIPYFWKQLYKLELYEPKIYENLKTG